MKLCNMRLVINKHYWQDQLEIFEKHQLLSNDSYVSIEFGKQYIKGGYSVCWIDNRNHIPKQIHFRSEDVMLGYVQGYNEAISSFVDTCPSCHHVGMIWSKGKQT